MQELNLEASVANIPAVTDFVNAILEELDCPIKAQLQIDVAIDELFSNIAQYAYAPGTGPATVRVETEEDPRAVIPSGSTSMAARSHWATRSAPRAPS